jgi:ATP adenylyltransferase/5',5'''-P-1,P-4-tetraphosphate phosphorylase II
MSWEARWLRASELLPYGLPRGADSQRLPLRVQALLAQQRATWPQLREATDKLQEIQTRSHQLGSVHWLTQFNPARIVSTSANVDRAAIAARPCFLCAHNLPAAERALAFGEDYAILCNPFPVLPQHLVISHQQHVAQSIEQHFGALLDVTKALGEEFFTIYNGPRCGASAPDHLHFQAGRYDDLPFFQHLAENDIEPIAEADEYVTYTLPNYPLNVLIAESDNHAALIEWFQRSCSALAQVTHAEDEPLLNLIAAVDEDCWIVALYARSQHRPARYFAEGDEQLLVSPAAIDLGGLTVVPQPDHFARLDGKTLQAILREVTLDKSQFTAWLRALSER